MTAHLLVCLSLLAALCSGCRAAGGGETFDGFGTITTLFALPQRQPDWPKGELTGTGFEPDPDEQGATPGMRAILLAEGLESTAISALLQPGHRAWIKGEVFADVIRVDDIEVLPFPRAALIPDKAANSIGRFDLVEVGAWHNRMPPSTDKRHLVLTIRAENTAADGKDREVKVERVFYSFDADNEGVVAMDMSLIDVNTGMGSGKMEMALPHGKPIDLGIRGEDTYPDGHVEEQIYVIAVLSMGEERVILRGHTKIIAAY